MATLCELVSAGLLEKDVNEDLLWTWSYPSVTDQERALFTRKSCLSQGTDCFIPFLYSQLDRRWFYIYTCHTQDQDKLPKVTAFSLILCAKDFQPEKYEVLCRILAQHYRRTGSPTSMLEAYLSVVTKGTCASDDNGKFSTAEFSSKHAYANSNLPGIIEMFGVETILIYTALLLKKRIVVYFPPHSKQDLLQLTRSIPAFAWHRQNWSVVFPDVELLEEELEEMRASNHYVAGCTDATVESRSDLYDLFVNGPANQITVAPHAKEALAMGKLHKDIAMFMVSCVEGEGVSQQQVIKELANKTKELLSNLTSLADDDGHITLEKLQSKKMPPATHNFLFSLAACEGLVSMT